MDIFLEKHRESILGVVEGFDRIIFKGYLTSMFPDGAFGRYLYKRGVLLKDAGKFFESETDSPHTTRQDDCRTSGASLPLSRLRAHARQRSIEGSDGPGYCRAGRDHRRPGLHLLGARTLCLVGRRRQSQDAASGSRPA